MAIASRESAREDEALGLLARTQATPAATRLLLASFVVLLSLVVVTQPFVRRAPSKQVATPAPDAAPAAPTKKVVSTGIWQRLTSPPEAETLRRLERQIEDKTAMGLWVRPAMQRLLLDALHQGSANVVVGNDGWLFYRKDVDHLLGHAFLDPDRLQLRSRSSTDEGGRIQPDPVRAIAAFAQRLLSRNIRLVVLPVPVKASIYPEELSPTTRPGIENASYPELLRRLRESNITVVDLVPALSEARRYGLRLYSRRDTHWNANGIAVAAELVSPLVKPAVPGVPLHPLNTKMIDVSLPGDLDGLLKLPAPPELVTCNQARDANGMLFEPRRGAPVVLLGDSFSTVCTNPGIGGGLAALLATELGVDVDVVATAGGGSRDSRVAFESDPDRFTNTRVVVWEFVTRSLTFGNWR